MKTLTELEEELRVATVAYNDAKLAIADKKKQTLVQCTRNNYGDGCGQAFHINELEYIQTHWYTEPHGCIAGDYWNCGEGQFMCPACGHLNRLYDRPDIEELSRLFKSIVDTY